MKALLTKSIEKVFSIGLQNASKKNESSNTQVQQIECVNQFKLMKRLLSKEELPKLSEVGFSVHSQFDEDGILLYIFSIIGTKNKKVVEICAGNGRECNATNLILNHGWHGLLLDGDRNLIEQAQDFFQKNKSTWLFPPVCKSSWITKENVNSIISDEGFKGEVDLLSLDIDGNDYWIWKEINSISPRVLICEISNICPDNLAITIPYKEDFCYTDPSNYHEEFRSVSSLAMINLSKAKGYRLIGSNKYGFNYVFMREDVGTEYFPEIPLSDISSLPYPVYAKKTRWKFVENAPWVTCKEE